MKKAAKKAKKPISAQGSALPEPLVPLAKPPVSGLYHGRRIGSDSDVLEMELRVDVDQSLDESVVLNYLSWDLFQEFSHSDHSWRVYHGSWVVQDVDADWQATKVILTGTALSWSTGLELNVEVSIPWTAQSVGPADVRLADSNSLNQYRCDWKSNLFRSVELQIDVCKSVNAEPILPDYDTHAHNDRPSDVNQRRLNIQNVYAEAGLNVTVNDSHTEIDDSAADFSSWSAAELHEAMVDHYDALSDQPQWKLWGLMAGSYDNPRVGGVMFDAAARFGGAGKAPERQGFAVFRDHSWFNSLVAGEPTTQAQAAASRKFLYTWVHEAGHAFNFLHSWDKARPDALSWMNYDWRYDRRHEAGDFWKSFRFVFDEEELIHLRHGSRNSVIMGGDSWGSGGHLESAEPLVDLELVDGGPPVEVLLRSSEWFQFMEPVQLEVRLRNLSKKRISIDADLQPEYGVVAILIRSPDGVTRHYEPLMCNLAEIKSDLLYVANKSQTGTDRMSESIDLTFGRDGFYFDRPGDYAIRVIYQGLDGTLIPSNLHRIRVGMPTTESEKLAQDFFRHEVGLALYLNGSQSSRLKGAMSTLRQFAERFTNNSLGAKAAAVVAGGLSKPFHRIKDGKLSQLAKAEPKEALEITEPAVHFFSEVKDRFANLPHRHLVELRTKMWRAIDEEKQANAEKTQLCKTLSGRGVNSSVISDIKKTL